MHQTGSPNNDLIIERKMSSDEIETTIHRCADVVKMRIDLDEETWNGESLRRSARLRENRRRSRSATNTVRIVVNTERRCRRWTEEDEQRLRDLRSNGMSDADIGKILDRTEMAIYAKSIKLKLNKFR